MDPDASNILLYCILSYSWNPQSTQTNCLPLGMESSSVLVDLLLRGLDLSESTWQEKRVLVSCHHTEQRIFKAQTTVLHNLLLLRYSPTSTANFSAKAPSPISTAKAPEYKT